MDGLELNASYNVGALFSQQLILEVYAIYTYLFHANCTQKLTGNSGADSTVTQDLQYVRKANGQFGLHLQTPSGWTTCLNARYIGSRIEQDNFGQLRPTVASSGYTTEGGYALSDKMLKYPDFLVFDLSASYTFNRHLKATCLVSNLLDENYTEKDGFNMPGRQFRFNLNYSF